MFCGSLTSIIDAESLQMIFDPEKVTYSSLIEFFYKMHDPTTKDRQGGDAGTQYRSAIFYHNEEQEKEAREITDKVQKQWWKSSKITTEILPAGEWWDAEVRFRTDVRLRGLRLHVADIPPALLR
jgi:peptide-methionine (S)-S-oxide reductase